MRRPWETANRFHARLATRAAGGDRHAFQALYRDLYPEVARFVARRVRGRADAEDAVAQVFHRLLEAVARLDHDRGNILGYALATARHVVADQQRSRRDREGGAVPDEVTEPADPGPGPFELLEAGRRRRDLAAVFAALPAEARELLELRFGDGLRHAEIAALTGGNEVAVKQRLSRLLRTLRGALAAPERSEEVLP
jgi:RNA polymerase sigma-70 factor (ECF subfamily)